VFESVFRPEVIAESPDFLHRELEREVSRLELLREKTAEVGDHKVEAALDRLDEEQVVDTVRRDPDARGEADRKLRDLKAAIDTVESALEWPELLREAHQQFEATREVVEANGEAAENERLKELAADIERAISDERIEFLRTRTEDLRDLGNRVVLRQPSSWIGFLEYLQQQRSQMREQSAAERLFAQAQRAINNNDFEALKAAVRQLIFLLPPDEREAAEARGGFGGTIIAQ
jgi:molecular chaperone DnaK